MQIRATGRRGSTGAWAFRALLVAIACLAASPALAGVGGPAEMQAFRESLSAQLHASDSPRDRALGSQLLETMPASGAHLQERGRILRSAAREAPNDRLVQAIWANLPVSDGRCRRRARCSDPAGALARLEPDNGAAWIPVVAAAWKRHDARAVDAGLRRLAASERFNEHLGEALGAWRDFLRRHVVASPKQGSSGWSASSEGDLLDLAFAESVSTAVPPADALVDACSRRTHPEAAPGRFEACARAARLMMGRSQTLSGRLSGVRILRASGLGAKDDVERVRTVTWQFEQYEKLVAGLNANAAVKINHMNMIESSGAEMRVVHYELASAGIALTPPAGWKQSVEGRLVEPLDDPPRP